LQVRGELTRDFDVLGVAIGTKSLVALHLVLLAEGVGIEVRRRLHVGALVDAHAVGSSAFGFMVILEPQRTNGRLVGPLEAEC
jgi:hypothetical protein